MLSFKKLSFYEMKALLYLSFVSLLCTGYLFAQTKKTEIYTLSPDKFSKNNDAELYLNDVGWRFIAEDDLKFKNPAYDDSSWDICQDIWLNADTLPKNKLKGYGWYRLKFRVDSSFYNQILGLVINNYGACEVYLDGNLLCSFGKVSTSAQDEKPFMSRLFPMPLLINNTPEHLLAIRFSNHIFLTKHKRYGAARGGHTIGVGVRITKNYQNRIVNQIITSNSIFQPQVSFYLLSGLLLTLGILHLLLYWFLAKTPKNLWFGLFSMVVPIESLLNYYNWELYAYEEIEVWFRIIDQVILVPLSAFFLLAFLYSFFYPRFPTQFKYFVGLLFFQIIYTSFFELGYITWTITYFAIYQLLFLAFLVESIRVIIKAVRQKKPDALIIGIGVGVFTLSFALVTLLGILGYYNTWWLIYTAFAMLAFSVSIYIARSSVRTIQELAQKMIENEKLSSEKQRILENQKVELEKQVQERTVELKEANEELHQTNEELKTTIDLVEQERQKSDKLLLNILPEETAQELKATGVATPKHYDLVSVLFTDFKGFSQIAEKLSPQEVIENLNTCFLALDEICERHNLEKIKTIGDSYMCAGGIPVANTSNPMDCVQAGLEMQAWMAHWKKEKEQKGELAWELRLGIHSGPVVAGVIGKNKFAYDIWGDAVNLASRMESSGEAGKVNISGATYELIKDKFQCTYRGKIEAKNKGEVEMYFVESPQSPQGK
jgi:class 3 adenylate cyclase